jgi:arylamine N-acetyltransferase
MVNIVTIDNTRYLVDVGFGSNGPTHPVPMKDGHIFPGVSPARGRLQYTKLEEHTDPNQRVWLFSGQQHQQQQEREEGGPVWRDFYAFVDIEFFPADFEVMNLRTMTAPQSYFVQTVLCMRTMLDVTDLELQLHNNKRRQPNNVSEQQPEGLLILHKDQIKKRIGENSDVIEKFDTEMQRIEALEKYFGIVLSFEEQRAIRGMASELRGRSTHP